jgi:hypothetical protein
MRDGKARMMGVVLVVAMLALGVASSAAAAPAMTLTTRSIVAADASMTITVESTGDAGTSHGNVNPWTSPVDPSGGFYWFNKDVRVTEFLFADESLIFSGATFGLNAGSGYTSQTVLAEPYSLSYDGVYSIVASGTDTTGTVTDTDEITPAFGIDQTDPEVTTDRVPFYAGIATVTVTATDTMSGIENVLFNVDGARNDVWEPDMSNPSSFSVGFPFIGTGIHIFSWTAFDNAGNAVHGSETFSIDNVAPTTTSDLVSSYDGTATINLTATDNDGGSGVAHTYCSLDGTTAVETSSVVVPPPADGATTHTVEFWSVDAVGNVETPHNTGDFTVNSVHMITVTAPAHGTITPSGVVAVGYGSNSATFTVTPQTGYHTVNVYADGSPVGAVGAYQFANVTDDHVLAATFAINTYTIRPSRSNTHGTISPSGRQTVNYGARKTFTMRAKVHYKISKVLVDGRSVGKRGTYRFSNVAANHTIKAYFVHR